MSEHDNDRALIERIVSALEARHGAPDGPVRRRLDSARRLALSPPSRRPARRFAVPLLVSAGAAAALAWVALWRQPAVEPEAPPRTEDLDLLTRQEFELFVEDPEFYAWLAGQAEEAPREPRPPEKSG